MNAILWIFIAFAMGLMLFAGLQDGLPDEFGFLKNKGTTTEATTVVTQTSQYKGWTIKQAGSVVEFTRPLIGRIESNGTNYDTPEIGILCNNGKLDLRLDTRLPTTGAQTTPVTITGLGASEWDKSATKNIFPKEPQRVLHALLASSSISIKVSYAALGAFTTQLDTSDLPKLVATLPATCQ